MSKQKPEAVIESPELEEEDVVSYWTLERMEAAQPIPFTGEEVSLDQTQVSVTPLGPPVQGASRGPDDGESDEHPKS